MTYVLGVLHSEDLLSEVLEVVEGRLSRDGVNQSETLAVLHVQVSHRSELLLQTDGSQHRWSGTYKFIIWTPLYTLVSLWSLSASSVKEYLSRWSERETQTVQG